MEQEHRLTYKAGITRTPSDFICQDGELAECINLATDTEELKPMVQPSRIIEGSGIGKVIYIHKYNSRKRYIHLVYSELYQDYVLYCSEDGTTLTAIDSGTGFPQRFGDDKVKVTSIGKTLIVSHEGEPLHYFSWQDCPPAGTPYFALGKLKEPRFNFWLLNDQFDDQNLFDSRHVLNTGSADGIIYYDYDSTNTFRMKDEETYNTLIAGLYAKNKKAVHEEKAFCNPFFIRTALEMYDGTYTHISQPILMMPCVTGNSCGIFVHNLDQTCTMSIYTRYAKLHFTQSEDLTEWSDIVKGIAIFASREIDVYNMNVDQPYDGLTIHGETCRFDGIFRTEGAASTTSEYTPTDLSHYVKIDNYVEKSLNVPARKDRQSVINEIKGTSIFYKLCTIGLKALDRDTEIGEYVDQTTIQHLETQERLLIDDNFSRSSLYPGIMYTYNSRLNLASVSRGMFGGFDFFLPFDNANESTYVFYVRIKTDTSYVWVSHTKATRQKQGIYFYYPDQRADRVVITRNGTVIANEALTEHPRLNGAYYLKGLPGVTDEPTSPSVPIDTSTIDVQNDFREALPNYVVTSEVNNPWVFRPDGYNKVSTGRIVGISTTTQALSQGQFGQFPLLVFSENGIWAMAVDNTGLYQSIQPMSRDVCINPSSIIQTDGAVFFVSKKGLMVVAGNDVRCVSERMNGRAFDTATLTPLATGTEWAGIVGACQGERTFLDYIRDERCVLAYDYIDSRILIMNPGFGFAFAYGMADGTISKTILPCTVTSTVNDYPDYLLQGRETIDGAAKDVIYSFYEKPREENVAERQLGFVLTRPMKLAGPVSQVSLRQLMNVGTWRKKDAQGNELSCVKTEVYLSEDMQTWFPDISRHGAAARYYRLALFIKMLPTERLSGTILTEQERRSHNMR